MAINIYIVENTFYISHNFTVFWFALNILHPYVVLTDERVEDSVFGVTRRNHIVGIKDPQLGRVLEGMFVETKEIE